MNKIKIYDKEYNCSNIVYLYIKGLESEKRLLKMEVSTKDKYINELQQRIDKAIEILQDYDLVENKDKVISDTFKALRGEDND